MAPKTQPQPAAEGTALAVIPRNQFLALAEGSDAHEALQANLSTGETVDESMLVRVSTPAAGGTTWQIKTVSGVESVPAIEGLLVLVVARGVLWPADEPSEGTLPVLVTYDLKVAEQVGPIPDDMLDVLNKHKLGERKYDWANLPYNQFGSGKKGLGKRCKEQRVMFLLRAGDTLPLVVSAQPGSLMNIRRFLTQLPVPHWRAIVRLELHEEKNAAGIKYAQIVPTLIGTLSKEDGEVVRTLYTERMRDAIRKLSLD